MRAVLFSLAATAVACSSAQPAVQKFKTIVDLRPLLADSNATLPQAMFVRDGSARLVGTVRIDSSGHQDGYVVPISPQGVLGTPVKLNQGDEHAAYDSSWLDSRGNFYYYSVYSGIWKFDGLGGTRIGQIPARLYRSETTNSLGNLFTAVSSAEDPVLSGPTDLSIRRYSTGMIPNFTYQEQGYRMFEMIICDRQDNLWALGCTFIWGFDGSIQDTGFVVRKYDPQMNLLFDKSYPGLANSRSSLIACDDSGNIYAKGFGGSGTVLRKIDPQGNLVWQKPFVGGTGEPNRNKLVPDELGRLAVIAGAAGGNPGRFVQYSPAGNILRDIPIPGSTSGVELRRDTYGQLYGLTRNVDPQNANRVKGVITKFDAAGTVLFSIDVDTLDEKWDPVALDVDSKSGDIYVTSRQSSPNLVLGAVHGFVQAPVARPDTLSVPSATQVSLPVFANDRYVGSFPYQFKITKAPMHGKILTGSTMYYKSDPGYHGPDEFYYRAVRNGLESFTAKVSLTVQ